jgi:hypothetical protein
MAAGLFIVGYGAFDLSVDKGDIKCIVIGYEKEDRTTG